MFKYATDLRSRPRPGSLLTFVRYEEVPGNISAKVIEQARMGKGTIRVKPGVLTLLIYYKCVAHDNKRNNKVIGMITTVT